MIGKINMNKFVATPYKNLISYDGAVLPRYQIARFAKEIGYEPIEVPAYHQVDPDTPEWDSLMDRIRTIPNGSLFIHQLPAYASEKCEQAVIDLLHSKNCIVAAYIHDIDYLRDFDDTFRLKDLFNSLDVVMVASQPVIDFLKDQGVTSKLIISGMWDYHADNINGNKLNNLGLSINYAGNLFKPKAGFLKPLSEISDYPINVWGYLDSHTINLNEMDVNYKGKTNSPDLNIPDGWGLIWDDNEDLANSGYNKYQKYNWAYKLALYLRNGLPIIVRKNTNMGDYIEKHNLGATISSLDDINYVIDSVLVNQHNFELIKKQCYNYSKLLDEGFFIKSALRKVENIARV